MRLLLIIGPPAVGKMTVGREIAARSPFRLFHNHHTIEPLVETFGYGTPAFCVLNQEFRRRVVEEAARHELDLIFTFVWDMEDPEDVSLVEELIDPYRQLGAEIRFVELVADLATRLERNRGADRLAAKATKRDLEFSERNVRESEAHLLNSDPDADRQSPADRMLAGFPHLRLVTSDRTPAQVADDVLAWLAAAPY